MPSKIRMNRIADRIRNELSAMLVTEISDPRLNGVSVTDVKVDRELAFADIYVSAVEGVERSKEVLDGLHSATGYMRRVLSDRVDLRVFPRLRFHWDVTPERADHIERVLATLRDEDHPEGAAHPEVVPATDEADQAALDEFSVTEDLQALDQPDLDESEFDDDSPVDDDERA